jgi:hypothetical protein
MECPLRQEVGHRAGEGRCTKFQVALAAQRKKARSDGTDQNRPNQVPWDGARWQRYWHSGHTKEACGGLDRENLCCLFCNLEGHVSGGENCPKWTIDPASQPEKVDEEGQGEDTRPWSARLENERVLPEKVREDVAGPSSLG